MYVYNCTTVRVENRIVTALKKLCKQGNIDEKLFLVTPVPHSYMAYQKYTRMGYQWAPSYQQ